MTDIGRRLTANANGQHGHFTRRQATAGGASRAMLRSRTQSGHLEKSGVNTYTSSVGPQSQLGDLCALVLDVGDPVWVCGPTAAALHGFDGYDLRPPFHLLLPRGRNVRRIGHVIHTTLDIPLIDRCVSQGLAALSPTRTIIDLARAESADRITAALDSALRDGGTAESFLHQRIAALRSVGRYGIPELLAAIEGSEFSRGGHSWLERRFLELVGAAGLSLPATQVQLARTQDKLVRVDCYFVEAELVVELLGYRWHRSREQMNRDTARMNQLLLDGKRVVQFTYDDVAQRPVELIGTLRRALNVPEVALV